MFPNFIIVGAPKAGTTSLYHYLSEHPDVFMSEPKEVNYFSASEILEQKLYYKASIVQSESKYQDLFRVAGEAKAIGEGSVSYLFYPETPKKIKQLLPDVKIIILLRNPIERAFSHYLMDYRMGLVDVPFEDIVCQKSKHRHQSLHYQQYVELGMYYNQVKRYLDLFGTQQVKVYLQEDLRASGDALIRGLYQFLEVDSTFKPDLDQEHNAFSMPRGQFVRKVYASHMVRSMTSKILPKGVKDKVKNIFFERNKKPELSEKTKMYLQNIYQDDVKKLELLINRNLSTWLGGKNL